MAVEDRASAPPSTSAPSTGTPAHQATSAASAVVSTTCEPPSPTTARRRLQNCASENSRPIMNSRNTTPISASRCRVSLAGIQPRAWGPARMPTSR